MSLKLCQQVMDQMFVQPCIKGKRGSYSMRFFSIILFLFLIRICDAKSNSEWVLEPTDYQYILGEIDTSGSFNNYHIVVSSGYSDSTKSLTVWINKRLGSSMLLDAGFSICEFFDYKEGKVYVYTKTKCFLDIPSGYINELDGQYSYLERSPMHKENGFEMSLLIEKRDHSKTELLNPDVLLIDDDDF